jgi:signal transduction histidine kinase
MEAGTVTCGVRRPAEDVTRPTADAARVVAEAARGAAALTGAAGTVGLVYEPGSELLRGTDGHGPVEIELARFPLAARALATGQPQSAARPTGQNEEIAEGLGLEALTCLPLHVEHEPMGVLVLDCGSPSLEGATAVARVAALALRELRAPRAAEVSVSVTLAAASRAAHELHDDVAQLLFSIGSTARTLRADPALSARVRPALETILELSGQASRRLRSALHALRGGPLERDLLPALRDLVDAARARTRLAIELDLDHDLRVVDRATADVLYRVCREGLANVERHAQAERCRIECSLADGWATATVEDDGLGPRAADGIDHFGLEFLTEAVASLGGSLQMARRDPTGTRLTARVPLAA